MALAWVAENPVDESGSTLKEKQLPGAAIRGIIDIGRGEGSTFTLNVYREPFTPAGVKAKGFK